MLLRVSTYRQWRSVKGNTRWHTTKMAIWYSHAGVQSIGGCFQRRQRFYLMPLIKATRTPCCDSYCHALLLISINYSMHAILASKELFLPITNPRRCLTHLRSHEQKDSSYCCVATRKRIHRKNALMCRLQDWRDWLRRFVHNIKLNCLVPYVTPSSQ